MCKRVLAIGSDSRWEDKNDKKIPPDLILSTKQASDWYKSTSSNDKMGGTARSKGGGGRSSRLVLNDHWSKKIYRPKTIVWSGATFILRWTCLIMITLPHRNARPNHGVAQTNSLLTYFLFIFFSVCLSFPTFLFRFYKNSSNVCQGAVFLLIILLALFGNLLVIVSVLRTKNLR